MIPSIPLLSCESTVSAKENPDRKKKQTLLYVLKSSWRHHSRCLEDVFKRSWRRLQNVLKTFWRYLKDVFLLKTSWRCLSKKPWRCLKDVLKTSWKRLEDVLKMSWRRFCKASWRRMTKTNILVLIKVSWRSLLKTFE